MSLYLLLNILIISIPFLLSFERRVCYVRKWPKVFFSIFIVGSVYVAWDALATGWGHWAFNSQYVGHKKVFGLPVEEILFFITTPFSCLFIYEVLSYFKKDKIIAFNKFRIYGAIIAMLGLALAYHAQAYTSLALIMAASFLFAASRFSSNILFSLNFWRYLAICYVPFLIFNGILTGLPVVQYNPHAIWGLRIISVPIEDFIYNFSYLGFTLLAYKAVQRRS